jgi:hypothetical protein
LAGKDRTYIARYPGYEDVTLTLNEFHVSKSKLSGEIGQNAQRGIMAEYKRAYLHQHGKQIASWLAFDRIDLEETEESASQLSGCGCECAGCDQGYHCRKSARGCHM